MKGLPKPENVRWTIFRNAWGTKYVLTYRDKRGRMRKREFRSSKAAEKFAEENSHE